MTDYSKFLQSPNSMSELFAIAEIEDLNILVDYITDKGEGRIALEDTICHRLMGCQKAGYYTAEDRDLIQREVRLFGGNTLANLYRDLRTNVSYGSILDKLLPDTTSRAVQYQEVVGDVASHLKAKVSDKDDVIAMEDAILRKVFQDAFEKMTPEERKQILEDLGIGSLSMLGPGLTATAITAGKLGGFKTFKLAVIVANAIAKAILGRGLPFAAGPIITRTLSIALGPVGWVLTGIWSIADMASPAYRVTVPCVIHVAYMRQKAILAATAKVCPSCMASNGHGAKFCNECGTSLA